MSCDHELQRLVQVYSTYRQSHAAQVRWNRYNPGNRAILEERELAIRRLLQTERFLPLADQRILEIGCGSGKTLASLLKLGAQSNHLYGVDLLPDRIAEARRCYPDLYFQCVNAEHLDFPDNHFDLILLFTVFSSILDSNMAHNVSREACRILKPHGAVVWYDFRYNNPRNRNVKGMTRNQIMSFFPKSSVSLQTITLLPPLARRLGKMTAVLYPMLSSIPFLRTHYLGLLIKPM